MQAASACADFEVNLKCGEWYSKSSHICYGGRFSTRSSAQQSPVQPRGCVAHMVEHSLRMRGVRRSILLTSTFASRLGSRYTQEV